MKKIFGFLLATVLLPAAQVQAWVGGPFGGGRNYTSGGDDGVYEAVATMSDGIGMYRFAVQNSSTVAAGNAFSFADEFGTSNVQFGGLATALSSHVWYYRGVTYYGQCIGTVNSSLNRVSCVGNANDAGINGAGQAINGISLVGGTSGTVDDNNDNNTNQAAFGDVGVLAQGSPNVKSFVTSQFIGTFDARQTEYTFVKRFRARGTATFFGTPSQTFILIDTDDVFFIAGNSLTQEVTADFGNNNRIFPKRGHTRVINVIGSRVSYNVTGSVSSGN